MKARLWFLSVALLMLPITLFSQTCSNKTITATITDSDAQAWVNGSFTVTLSNPSGGQRPVCTATGVPITTTYSGTLNGSGALSVSLPDTSKVDPAGTRWIFSIQPNASVSASVMNPISVTANASHTASFSSQVPRPRFFANIVGPASLGYNDNEPLSPVEGSTYLVSTTGFMRTYHNGAWQTGGGGGTVTWANDLATSTNSSQNVVGIRSKAVPTLSAGYLHYDGTNWVFDAPVTWANDLLGSTSTSQIVSGIKSKPVPSLSAGYLHYDGTNWVFDTPSVVGGMTWQGSWSNTAAYTVGQTVSYKGRLYVNQFAVASPGNPTLIQSVAGFNATTSTLTSVVLGNVIVVDVTCRTDSPCAPPTDSIGNTYTLVSTVTAADNYQLNNYVTQSVASGNDDITPPGGISVIRTWIASEWSGLSTTVLNESHTSTTSGSIYTPSKTIASTSVLFYEGEGSGALETANGSTLVNSIFNSSQSEVAFFAQFYSIQPVGTYVQGFNYTAVGQWLKLSSFTLTASLTNLAPDIDTVHWAQSESINTATLAMPTGSLTANTCSGVTVQALANVTSTSTFKTAFVTSPLAVTGWGATGGLVLSIWPDATPANGFDWAVCNQTSNAITGGTISINVSAN